MHEGMSVTGRYKVTYPTMYAVAEVDPKGIEKKDADAFNCVQVRNPTNPSSRAQTNATYAHKCVQMRMHLDAAACAPKHARELAADTHLALRLRMRVWSARVH